VKNALFRCVAAAIKSSSFNHAAVKIARPVMV
jgi:hypothetical protein